MQAHHIEWFRTSLVSCVAGALAAVVFFVSAFASMCAHVCACRELQATQRAPIRAASCSSSRHGDVAVSCKLCPFFAWPVLRASHVRAIHAHIAMHVLRWVAPSEDPRSQT